MNIKEIAIKNFRCFGSQRVTFTKPFVIIQGPNGTGKTSLLEALYYSCYLRSFRTRSTRELIHHGDEAFSIKITYQEDLNEMPNELAVGYSPARRAVKLNNTQITTYKELLGTYRIVAITDEDLSLIKGAPEQRRAFMDQAITLHNPDYRVLLKRYAAVLEQRNALLHGSFSKESYGLWTEQLDELSQQIRDHRKELLVTNQEQVNKILETFFEAPFTVALSYREKLAPQDNIADLIAHERLAKHTLFGAHLDDCRIMIADKASKKYASRGQQKLTAILLKIAQPSLHEPSSHVFLLDDAISDLDQERLTNLLRTLNSYNTQVIITSPLAHPFLGEICKPYDTEMIDLAQVKAT